ncbi:NAD(P)/FAD-dependent oxidoreductase [Nocardioides plantarum]|uniref:NAD(P)/FAD-dependent oxidoreductase n=1 Tax=Nocardioides plantarum TaxID=29299 RepID=A0ABV5KGB7_9ACTN|nr:FAD-dependent oxidoreductase [Nocardioides plantarum]
MSRRIVVLGAGHAGAEVVAALRAGGFTGDLVLVGDETAVPYQRPPLSKAFLQGTATAADLPIRPRSFYDQQHVDLALDRRADSIDTHARTVRVGARSHEYDVLVLALGGRVRALSDPVAAGATNLHHVKTCADVERLRERLRPGTRLGVVGGGFVGLEVAASARDHGAAVSVLELGPRLLGRVCSEVVATHVASVHRRRGVEVRTAATGLRLEADQDGRISRLVTDQGDVEVDEVVVGIGMVPETELASRAGLATNDGVLVDVDYRASAPEVFAIGDCARVVRAGGSTRRLESAPHAAASARRAAAAILGRPAPTDGAPWFWSHQFDVKIQMAGDPDTRPSRWVTRGSVSDGSFLVFGIVEDRIVRVEAVDRPAEFTQTKPWLGRPIPALIDRLTDESVSLRQLLTRH